MPSKMPQFNRRVPADTVDQIKRLAAHLNLSEAQIMAMAVSAFAAKVLPGPDPKPAKRRAKG